jgi:hypothetical protein
MKTQRETLQLKYFNYLILEAIYQAFEVMMEIACTTMDMVHGDEEMVTRAEVCLNRKEKL